MGKKRKEEKSIENPTSNEGIPQTQTYDNPINTLTPVPAEADPAAPQYRVVAQATVRAGMSTKANQTRSISRGQIVTVFETGQSEGHQRARISGDEWVSISTAKGSVILKPFDGSKPKPSCSPCKLPTLADVIRGHPLASIFFLEAEEYGGYPKKDRVIHAVIGFITVLTASLISVIFFALQDNERCMAGCLRTPEEKKRELVWKYALYNFTPKFIMYALDAASCTPCMKWRARRGGLGKEKNLCMEKWLHVWAVLFNVVVWLWIALNFAGNKWAMFTFEANLDVLKNIVVNYLFIEQVETLFAFLTGAAGMLDAFNLGDI